MQENSLRESLKGEGGRLTTMVDRLAREHGVSSKEDLQHFLADNSASVNLRYLDMLSRLLLEASAAMKGGPKDS